jgi:hypothetical protein
MKRIIKVATKTQSHKGKNGKSYYAKCLGVFVLWWLESKRRDDD